MYSYKPNKIPSGRFDARLDLKIWSKRIIAISCYFTKIDTKEKFVVTVYCDQETAKFQLSFSTVHFSICPIGVVYGEQVHKSEKSKVLRVKAEPAQHVTK